jgi:hypothetical protein
MKTRHLVAAVTLAMPLAATAAYADDAPAAAPAAPAAWADTLKIGAQFEAGVAGNFESPSNNLNFGQLYTDRSNAPVVNQILLSIGRPVDPKATDYDFGFKLQGIYGTDARYTHFAYFLDNFSKGQMQVDVLEASFDAFTPWLTSGGINWQIGMWPTLLGYETIDASTNPFYTHSYIFNFGLPVKHTGANAIIHATDTLDVYAGITAGNQTIYGADTNGSSSFIGGAKYSPTDSFNVLGLVSYGPEDASKTTDAFTPRPLNANKYNRTYVDGIITYKATDALTLTTELNYVNEDAGLETSTGAVKNAEAGGFAQYASLTLNDQWTANLRAEVFADTRGFFVAAYPGSLSAVQALEGVPYTGAAPVSYPGHTTYGEITVGATYKPTMPDSLSSITALIRPELRFDNVLGGPGRFDNGKDETAVMASIDLVLTY